MNERNILAAIRNILGVGPAQNPTVPAEKPVEVATECAHYAYPSDNRNAVSYWAF